MAIIVFQPVNILARLILIGTDFLSLGAGYDAIGFCRTDILSDVLLLPLKLDRFLGRKFT